MDYKELGTVGINAFHGFIQEAYSAELFWPTVEPLYRRLFRSDPEVTMARLAFGTLARSQRIEWELPDGANDAEKKAQEFAQQVTDDIEGGIGGFLEKMATQCPMKGWGFWEVVPGLRDPGWTPPGEDDPWRSQYDDGRIGIRRLAWRDQSSFNNWDMTASGRVRGFVQRDMMGKTNTIPVDRGLHVTFGDRDNPEGLALLETIWRLERIHYGFQVIQGIGFEHSAGYLDVTADNGLTDVDMPMIDRAARNVMTAQEGNYAAWPRGVRGELKDVTFSAGSSLLETIRYYSMLKLMVFNMQWMALSGISGSGSYSAMTDSSSMAVATFNAMQAGFANQFDNQVGARLFLWNNFPGMRKRPRATIPNIEKSISLSELAQILAPLTAIMPLGDDDFKAIRKRTGFLPETLPQEDATVKQPEPQPEPAPADEDQQDDNGAEDDNEDETSQPDQNGENADNGTAEQAAKLAEQQAYWQRYLLQHPEAMRR